MLRDIGELCIACHEPTGWGSGRFVNRIPADNGTETGYLCPDCQHDPDDDECRCDFCEQDRLDDEEDE